MKRLSIVWDVTRLCPWNCDICCMGAVTGAECLKDEMSLAQKEETLRQMAELREEGWDLKLDLSGGEIMTSFDEHMKLIGKASELLGKNRVGISASGYRIDENAAKQLAEKVKDVELTLDCLADTDYPLRKKQYHQAAMEAALRLKKAGVNVGIQTVLCRSNADRDTLQRLLNWLCKNEIDEWSILRFFPKGRGRAYIEEQLSDEENLKMVKMIQELHREVGPFKPRLNFHYLLPGHEKSTNECRCVTKSIGILPDGQVTACFWALDDTTDVENEKFLLGNVTDQTLKEILRGPKAMYWTACVHDCELCA